MFPLAVSFSLRLFLLVAGGFALVSVVQLTANGFDTRGFFLEETTTSSAPDGEKQNNDDNIKWISFLGGEFTFSCLLPLGYHLLQASLQGGRSLSTLLVLSVLAGVALGQVVAENDVLVDSTWMLAMLAIILLYIVLDKRGGAPVYYGLDRTTVKTARFYSMVRIIVKIFSFLLLLTGIMVLGMGLTAKSPADLLPSLLWTGFGYEYNLVETFGKTTTESKDFFGMLLCTMLGTICQTFCLAIWMVLAPVGSPTCRQGLAFSCTGVPLIIIANSITAASYQKTEFTQGRDCMIAHIFLLVQTNAHIPIVWWIHELWMELAVIPYSSSQASTAPAVDAAERAKIE